MNKTMLSKFCKNTKSIQSNSKEDICQQAILNGQTKGQGFTERGQTKNMRNAPKQNSCPRFYCGSQNKVFGPHERFLTHQSFITENI